MVGGRRPVELRGWGNVKLRFWDKMRARSSEKVDSGEAEIAAWSERKKANAIRLGTCMLGCMQA